MSAVHEIRNKLEFQNLLSTSPVVILDHYAEWCGPCKFIAPKFAAFAAQYPQITFAKANVDNGQDTGLTHVQSVPLIELYVNGQLAGEVKIADEVKLEALVRQGQQYIQGGGAQPEAPKSSGVYGLGMKAKTSARPGNYKRSGDIYKS